jgi:hypothetical protein
VAGENCTQRYDIGAIAITSLPLIKNWFPLLSKNFEPIAEMVGIAAMTGKRPARKGAPANTKKTRMI